MARCDWCEKIVSKTNIHVDFMGDKYNICDKCLSNINNSVCRKCGGITDTMMMIKGLCTNCMQVEMMNKSKRKEEARLGVDRDMIDIISSEISLTDEDYNKWLMLGNAFSPEDMKSSSELKRMWILVKLTASGIYDTDVVNSNIENIEKLLDRNFSKLVGNTCRILIGNTPETRKIVRENTVIDYEDGVYIISV